MVGGIRVPVPDRQDWIANGALLGWLIDLRQRRVHVYRPGRPAEVLEDPARVEADPDVAPGLVLDLERVFPAR